MVAYAVIAAVLGAVLGVAAAAMRSRRAAEAQIDAGRTKSQALLQRGRREAQAIRTRSEAEGRSAAVAERSRRGAELEIRSAELRGREEALAASALELDELRAGVADRDAELSDRHSAVQMTRARQKALVEDRDRRLAEVRARLEERAGVIGTELASKLGSQWIEAAEADRAHRLRAIEGQVQDGRWDREAERLLTIASARYQNHFLTERLISNVKIGDGVADLLSAGDGRVLGELERVANVKLNLSESGETVRLEGLDGVGREIARRALAKLSKKSAQAEPAAADPEAWATTIKEQLEREILGLGRKAFQVLGVARAHPEIVDLVGRLNWRTSYTQNQWLHAVEASFLAGMMAEEMDLDVKLARRATLMHDIGKALTHEIEGSHAVIGADIARRLGEDEIVANAIGAHHLDEPMNSVYAHLVAAADAMSGARPGARREHEGGYNTKLQDLERIGRSVPGAVAAYAVHGGRELRVYVDDQRVSDLQAVELSSEIADQVADELIFPGQIKVTVIRATEAVSTAS